MKINIIVRKLCTELPGYGLNCRVKSINRPNVLNIREVNEELKKTNFLDHSANDVNEIMIADRRIIRDYSNEF